MPLFSSTPHPPAMHEAAPARAPGNRAEFRSSAAIHRAYIQEQSHHVLTLPLIPPPRVCALPSRLHWTMCILAVSLPTKHVLPLQQHD